MKVIQQFEDHVRPARDLICLYKVLCNQQQRRAQSRVLEKIQRLPGVKSPVLDTARSSQLFLIIMRGPLKINRATFSPRQLEFLLRQAVVALVTALEGYFLDEFQDKFFSVYSSVSERLRELNRLINNSKQKGRIPSWKSEYDELIDSSVLKIPIALKGHLEVRLHPGQRSGHSLKRAVLKQFVSSGLQSPKAISNLFKHLDLNNIWKEIARENPKRLSRVTLDLEDLNRRRNQIIHRADRPLREGSLAWRVTPEPVALEWVEAKLELVRQVVQSSSRVISRHVKGSPGSNRKHSVGR